MSGKLLQKLRQWRDTEAKRRGTDTYRILQNRSLEEIAENQPETKEELLQIHGIAETKCDKYGDELLEIIAGSDEGGDKKADEPIPVGSYLTQINDVLADQSARVRGEIVEFDIRDNYLFFTIKDAKKEAAMQCFMWRREYDISDVTLEEGLEVAVTGIPEVYQPNGRFTFRAATLELVGEGALKKAYEKLKAKLADAGLFADEAKKDIPAFPQKVGLITSKESDAYHDFLANLHSFGFSVKFFPSRVQGAKAVNDLLEALNYFSGKLDDLDVLVITRGGGGNLEVLQAFNNEAVVKKLFELDMPVITGIGHEQDVPLAAMAADKSVSTPTACAELLNKPWESLTQQIQQLQNQLLRKQEEQFNITSRQVQTLTNALESHMKETLTSFRKVVNSLKSGLKAVGYQLKAKQTKVRQLSDKLLSTFESDLKTVDNRIDGLADQLKRVDPQRRLEQGYSIVYGGDGVISSIDDVADDTEIDVQISDGIINAQVNNTKSNDE